MKPTLIAFALASGLAWAGTDSKNDIAVDVPAKSGSGWYAAAFGGGIFADNFSGRESVNDADGSGGMATRPTVTNGAGGGGGLKLGYEFAAQDIFAGLRIIPAVEIEASYIDPKIFIKTDYDYTPPFIDDPHYTVRASGELKTASFFVNGLARFDTGTLVTPYIGVGAGFQYFQLTDFALEVDANGAFDHNGSDLSDNSLCFAAQGIAGLDFKIAERWSIFTEYHYMVAFNPSFSFNNYDGNGDSFVFSQQYLAQQLMTVGVRFHF